MTRAVPTVSVVIPTFHRRAFLPSVLAPVLADPGTTEVVVVVDGARDGTLEDLRALEREDARVVPLFIENRGEGGARQAGLERAGSEVVLFLDDDVVARPGLVTGHAKRQRALRRTVVQGYMPVATSGVMARLYAEGYERRCAIYERETDTVLRHLWAGNLSLRREEALEVPLVNPAYTERYHPDREYGLRLREAGFTGLFDRSLRAEHHYVRDFEGFLRDARSQGAGQALIARLHPGLGEALPQDRFVSGLPRGLAAGVELTRRPRAAAIANAALAAALYAAGAVGAEAPQAVLARVARRVAQQRGAIEVHRADVRPG